jgi:two-component system, cell cycle response regulator
VEPTGSRRHTERRLVRRLPALWISFGILCALFVITYYALPLPAVLRNLLYVGIAAMASLAVIVGVRRYHPRAWIAWCLLAAGQASYTIADAIFDLRTYAGAAPYPSLADAFYLLAYPLLTTGLIALIRHRTPQWQTTTMIDSALVGTAAALLWWVYLVHPLATNGAGSVSEQTVAAVYPALDLLLLVVALRLILGGGPRTPAYHLLLLSLCLMLVADVAFAVSNATGTFRAYSWVDAAWMGSYAAFGMAGLHPSMARMDRRSTVAVPDLTRSRMLALVLASLAAPTVLLIEHVRGRDVDIPVIAVACATMFLLVLGRMAWLVAVHRHEAMTDGLTGLYTRRFFESTVRVEHERSGRSGAPLAMLLVDADHFKQVNDTHGHPGGDRVLLELAERLRSTCRRADILARVGGEEFAVLMPGTTAPQALHLAGRIRRRVAESPFTVTDRTSHRVTVSVGVAVLPHDGRTTADLVRAADEALYLAKRSGRDRVAASSDVDTRARQREPQPTF